MSSSQAPPPILIAHNPVGAGDDPSTADVLDQVALVESGLAELGIASQRVAVAGGRAWEVASAAPEAVIFNLVESPPGSPYVHSAATAVFELLRRRFTGSSSAALWLTTDKLATRAVLAAEGLPVAAGGRLDPERPEVLDRVPPPWILKPAWEDASVGLDGEPVTGERARALARAAELGRRFPGQPVLAEHFLPGREFNVSLLAREGGVEVLPVAEMAYEGFSAGEAPILGYEAKWLTDSAAYRQTVRRFPQTPADLPLLRRAAELAEAAWHACGLAGYARVDLRLDEAGEPRILEVNTNPCLAGDAGFMAAARRAGLTAGEVVRRILAAASGNAEGTIEAPRPGATAPGVVLRDGLAPADRDALAGLLTATGFFNREEVEVALELVDDRLRHAAASHYRFLVAELAGEVVGYACWGPIPGTAESADLYWIAVDPRHQGRGAGAALLSGCEARIAAEGRSRVYVETAGRPQYEPTRGFYRRCGYGLAAELPDFYARGDAKVVFLKVLPLPS